MNPLNHVAIIMDGNGRWGLKHKNSRNFGHKSGLLVVEKIIKEALKNKIKYLTLFAFSTENWKRPESEISFLMELLNSYLSSRIEDFINNDIKIKFLGIKKFSKKINNLITKSENQTKNNKSLHLNIALNYGSKSEIVNAVKKIIKKKKIINQKNINYELYTKGIPDPDILIRTGNTNRLSNFLLWQIAYSEIFFIKKLWPDFNNDDFKKILNKYQKIKRNFGSV
jgi:undecaprenyl diphosphate synthase